MHATLLAIIQRTDINATTKSLAALVYAHTNGTGYAEIPLDLVVSSLGVGEHKLRTYRAALHRLGYMDSSVSGGALIVDVNLAWCASAPPSAPCGRAEDAERAASARSAPEDDPTTAPCGRAAAEKRAHTARSAEKRAASARSTAKSAPRRRAGNADFERDDAQFPPAPPSTELVNINQQQQQELTCCCSEGDVGEPDPDAAELLGAAGVAPHIVTELAGLGFETVARHVAAWQAARTGRDPVGVGALVKRLRQWPVPENLTAAELQAGLLAERVTDADLADWGVVNRSAASYVPAGYEHIVQH